MEFIQSIFSKYDVGHQTGWQLFIDCKGILLVHQLCCQLLDNLFSFVYSYSQLIMIYFNKIINISKISKSLF
jgi:hypothetical protein